MDCVAHIGEDYNLYSKPPIKWLECQSIICGGGCKVNPGKKLNWLLTRRGEEIDQGPRTSECDMRCKLYRNL